MTEKDNTLDPDAISRKLETVCRKLWDEDRVSAVALQAVTNEIAASFGRAVEIIASLRRELQAKESILRSEYELKLDALNEKLAAALSRTAGAEEECDRAKARINALLKNLEAKEMENAAFQEKHLIIEAQKDSERAAHMERFLEEENSREAERELFWEQRNQEFESEFKRREHEFEARHRDFLEETRRSAEESAKLLSQKEAKLAEARKQLEDEYRARETALREREAEYVKKSEEMDTLKRNLRKEISELTQGYSQKTRTEGESR